MGAVTSLIWRWKERGIRGIHRREVGKRKVFRKGREEELLKGEVLSRERSRRGMEERRTGGKIW